jgi:hypothetical protein
VASTASHPPPASTQGGYTLDSPEVQAAIGRLERRGNSSEQLPDGSVVKRYNSNVRFFSAEQITNARRLAELGLSGGVIDRLKGWSRLTTNFLKIETKGRYRPALEQAQYLAARGFSLASISSQTDMPLALLQELDRQGHLRE